MEFFFTKLLEICNTHDKKLQTHETSEEHSPLSGIIYIYGKQWNVTITC